MSKKLPLFFGMDALRENFVPWSRDTVIRKIKNNGFPAIKDEGGEYLFQESKVLEWFKRREVKAG